MNFLNFVVQFVTALGSSVDESTKATNITTAGIGSLGVDDNGLPVVGFDDADGELGDNQEMFSALGVLARPPDPETIFGKEYSAEAVALKTADGLVPVAWRDLRLDRRFPNGLPKGSVRVVGYGGGFDSFDSEGEGESRLDTKTIYVPYDFDSEGVPAKAHAIIVQPNAEDGITMTHGDGFQVAITDDGILLRTPDDRTFFQLREGELTLASEKILLKGSVFAGVSAETALPLLAGSASQACASLFLSP